MGEEVMGSIDAIEDVGAVFKRGVLVVYFLDVGVVQRVCGLLWGEEVFCGDWIALVILDCACGMGVRMGVDFKVLKIDHGKCSFLYFIASIGRYKNGYPTREGASTLGRLYLKEKWDWMGRDTVRWGLLRYFDFVFGGVWDG
jgi:hypothetical protein